nr:response regulator [Nitrospirota bacterium]
DPGQIEQVVMNLVINARDAMPEGGTLTITTDTVDMDETLAGAVGDVPPGSYITLAVSDTGHGMDAETQAHIFEPFFTTKEKGKGTGLGLASVYGIVRQSGGSISVKSAPAHGTTFTIYLPRIAHSAALAKEPEPISESIGGSETILLVEDEEAVRALVRESLEEAGYCVLEARDGTEALAISARHTEPIHLLLTDVVMPRNGRELTDQITRTRPAIKVLYMSGHTDDALGHRGVLTPNTHFLHKPFSPDTLQRKVRELLDTRTPPSA